jgi:dihydropyrimidinase
MGFDLVIRGAVVVTAGHREAADIGIAGGRIVQLGGTMTGAQELAAGGLLAIPGGVDAHTHLVHQGHGGRLGSPVWVDDFWSGSRAAIAGGITTIGNMTNPVPDETGAEQTPAAAIAREMAGAAAEAAVDWFLHPILLHPAALPDGEIAALAEGGHASIKMFLSDADLAADEPALLATASAAQAAGSVTLLHCEDGTMLRQAGQTLIAEGRGAVANFPDARPVAAEVAAVDQAIGIARRTGARVYIVHLSSAAALDRCRRARAAGLPVYVETRPLYLHLTRERFTEPDAAKYVGAPPLREASDREALWAGLASGDVDTVCSDHAPWTLEAKLDPALTVVTARQGVADLETLMPMLYSEGVAAGRISLDRFVALTSTNAARIFGLYPRKGTIAVGSDADIALWDPGDRRIIDGARMQSLAGYSVYDGWQVQGWPRFVVRRGQVVLADGEITARPGHGEWLRRPATDRTLPSGPDAAYGPGLNLLAGNHSDLMYRLAGARAYRAHQAHHAPGPTRPSLPAGNTRPAPTSATSLCSRGQADA